MRAQAFCVLLLLTLACKREPAPVSDTTAATASSTAAMDTGSRSNPMTIKVTSSAFQQGGSIPSQYTCEGKDVSPPLAWAGAPSNAKSLAMIVDDPDAPDPAKPQRVYVHWVVYNIPAGTSSLPENGSKSGMPKGAVQAVRPAPKAGQIEGVVWRDFKPGGGKPGVVEKGELGLPGVSVELRSSSGKVVQSAKTDANGTFDFTGVPGGTYQAAVGKSTFKATSLPQVRSRARNTAPRSPDPRRPLMT